MIDQFATPVVDDWEMVAPAAVREEEVLRSELRPLTRPKPAELEEARPVPGLAGVEWERSQALPEPDAPDFATETVNFLNSQLPQAPAERPEYVNNSPACLKDSNMFLGLPADSKFDRQHLRNLQSLENDRTRGSRNDGGLDRDVDYWKRLNAMKTRLAAPQSEPEAPVVAEQEAEAAEAGSVPEVNQPEASVAQGPEPPEEPTRSKLANVRVSAPSRSATHAGTHAGTHAETHAGAGPAGAARRPTARRNDDEGTTPRCGQSGRQAKGRGTGERTSGKDSCPEAGPGRATGGRARATSGRARATGD